MKQARFGVVNYEKKEADKQCPSAHRYPISGLGLRPNFGDTLWPPIQSKKGLLCK